MESAGQRDAGLQAVHTSMAFTFRFENKCRSQVYFHWVCLGSGLSLKKNNNNLCTSGLGFRTREDLYWLVLTETV